MDNREKYRDVPWERNCLFGYKHEDKRYQDKGEQCHAFVQGQGWKEVYTFGSPEECRIAVEEHNRDYKIINLIMPKKDNPFVSTNFHMGTQTLNPKVVGVIKS